MPVKITDSPELLAVILTLKQSGPAVRKEMRAAARKEANGLWKPLLNERAQTRHQQAVIVKGARVNVSLDKFELLAATSRRALSGGLIPASQWHGAEFGMTPKAITYVRNGSTVKSDSGAQFGARVPRGQVVFPSARKAGPRIVAAWIHGAVRGLTQANKNLETTRGN